MTSTVPAASDALDHHIEIANWFAPEGKMVPDFRIDVGASAFQDGAQFSELTHLPCRS